MRIVYPRSIGQLLLISFALVTIPLITALIVATVQLDRLAERSHRSVLAAELATRHSRSIAEDIVAMERSLAQYRVLDDPALYQAYLDKRAKFLRAAESLQALDLSPRQHAQVRALLRSEQELFGAYADPDGKPKEIEDVGGAFTTLSNQAREILAQASALIQREANNATAAASRLQRAILLQASAVIPAAVGLAILFTFLISKPLKQVNRAIRRLGAGEFLRPIEVSGPQDLRDLGERLDWLRRRILELEYQKLTFLRHISHELKTPLTAIREGAGLLADESSIDVNAENRQIVRIMQDSCMHLQELIENLLEFAKTRNPTTVRRISQPVPVGSLVDRVLQDHALAIAAKELTIDTGFCDAVLSGDANQLKIVIDNLVSNAIKYSPIGARVKISLAERGTDVVLSVKDEGPGVHPEDRPRVFEPFYQGRAVPTGPVKGTGLGLAIAKEYVEAHDGRLEIVDEPDGAHFRVVFIRSPAR